MIAESSSIPSSPIPNQERLIVALDCPTLEEAGTLVNLLGRRVSFYKIGWRLFLQGGLGFVEEVRSQGKRVFLDLKMDDIPETISTAVQVLRGAADFLTIHGLPATAKAAAQGRGDAEGPKLLFVTLLSSIGPDELAANLQYQGSLAGEELARKFILDRAKAAKAQGADGLIASGDSVEMLRKEVPEAIIVTPGVRPAGAATQDHQRLLTPESAIRAGSDYLVVGRPIWAAADPGAATEAIVAEIESASRAM